MKYFTTPCLSLVCRIGLGDLGYGYRIGYTWPSATAGSRKISIRLHGVRFVYTRESYNMTPWYMAWHCTVPGSYIPCRLYCTGTIHGGFEFVYPAQTRQICCTEHHDVATFLGRLSLHTCTVVSSITGTGTGTCTCSRSATVLAR